MSEAIDQHRDIASNCVAEDEGQEYTCQKGFVPVVDRNRRWKNESYQKSQGNIESIKI